VRAGKPALAQAGFTGDQLFFVALAQWGCELTTPEATRAALATDVHAPGHWRVNGPIADLPAFAQAFRCAPGTAMAPAHPCVIW
jgi:predicted metalloendopeptidase